MKIRITLLLIAIVVLVKNNNYAQSSELENLFEEISNYENESSPESVLYRGKHLEGEFGKIEIESFPKSEKRYREFVEQLNQIDDTTLTRQEYISKRTMLLKLNNSISYLQYRIYLIPFNAQGGFYNSMSWVLDRLPFNTVEDYELYMAWVSSYLNTIDDNIDLMKIGIKENIVAPKVIVKNTLQLLKTWSNPNPEKSPFFKPFMNMPEEWDENKKKEMRVRGFALINDEVLPSYRALEKFFQTKYMKAAKAAPGISNVTNGKEYYEDRVNYYTTLNMSPDSVHQLGLQEVKRIRARMEAIIKEVNFEGSYADFLHFLRTDEQFYAKTPQELLNQAAWLSKKAEGQLPRLFKKLYSLPFTVEPVPDDIAPTYTAGRFVGGSWAQQRAGIYWVNTYKLESRSLYTLPALSLHEAVPGHHLQGSLAGEIEGLPKFRTQYYISAFGEGWGLYSEYLGEEMNMYTTPYELFGRYTYEMWRACRLVVDTGMHYKGWTREQALDYMQSNTALSIHEVTTEIDRYIGWPGQAVSYKIGEIKIKQLRAHAQEQLGNQFDIREFHYQVLKNGSVPLKVLEEEIEEYISSVKNR